MPEANKPVYSIKHIDGVMHLDTEAPHNTKPPVTDLRIHPALPDNEES